MAINLIAHSPLIFLAFVVLFFLFLNALHNEGRRRNRPAKRVATKTTTSTVRQSGGPEAISNRRYNF